MSWTKEKHAEARAAADTANNAICAENWSIGAEGALELLPAALDEIERLTRWRAIETAPTDTWALVFCPNKHRGSVSHQTVAFSIDDDWWDSDSRVYPTHWLPLPEPPEEEK